MFYLVLLIKHSVDMYLITRMRNLMDDLEDATNEF